MRGLKFAFLALSSYWDALTMPGGTFDLSLASLNGFIDISPQSRTSALLNFTGLLNGTEPVLGLPIIPSLHEDLRLRCKLEAAPPFKGGQLMYSLLSELSQLWKSTDNPILLEPMRVRNVPFYSIEITVVPVRSSRIPLNRAKIAVYLTLLLEGLVSHSVVTSIWPGLLNCSLEVNPFRLEIGKLDVNMIPISTLGSESNSTERNNSSNSNRSGTAGEIAGDINLGADGIDVHQIFTGTVTTDRNALYLFTKLIFPIFQTSRQLRVTTVLPPGRLTREFRTPDGTFRIRMQTYLAADPWAFTMGELHEGLMRMLLRCAVADRWESMAADIIKHGNTVASVYLDRVQGSSPEGSGQNWPA